MSDMKPPTSFREAAMAVFLPEGGVFVYDIRDHLWHYDRSDESWTPMKEVDLPAEAKRIFALGQQASGARMSDTG